MGSEPVQARVRTLGNGIYATAGRGGRHYNAASRACSMLVSDHRGPGVLLGPFAPWERQHAMSQLVMAPSRTSAGA
jgi:hypothetical protein